MGETPLSRRTFLSAAAITGLSAPLLSACGTSGPAGGKGGGKTVQAWVLVDEAQNSVQKVAIDDFNKGSSGKVKLLPISSDGEVYTDKLRVSMGSPNPPDLLFNWGAGSIRNYVQTGGLVDLSSQLNADPTWKNSFLPSVLNAGQIDGKYYGIPMRGMQPVVLFYNKTLFAEQGQKPPATYDDLLKLVDFFKSKKIQPFALGGLDKWPELMWLEYLVERAGGPTVFANIAAGRPGAWRDPAITTALGQIQDLVHRGAFGTNFNSVNYVNDGAGLLFAKGKAAMHLMGSWEISNQVSRHRKFADKDLGFAPFPSVTGGKGDPNAVVGNPTNYFSISTKSVDKDAAIAFLKKEMAAPAYVDALIKSGDVPAVTGIEAKLSASPQPEFARYVYQLVQKAPSFTLSWDQALLPQFKTPLLANLQKVFSGKQTPQQFVTALESVK
ncbi:extracellular solute-binding protein [Actinoallomurus sp. NBC_01490]|uniref:ABC transporter substrate-binding protein n=1 Tax=Actinoallomurus sp. NBC_01490 TaxID=2903557 RepID=UPI002E36DB77|nr:extracellular solute-binding protein [Actinoallomurus sp. NBC_01490]